jgi:tetratricopeptide (TPR) repeat protein
MMKFINREKAYFRSIGRVSIATFQFKAVLSIVLIALMELPAWSAPPRMPEKFDKEIVERLLTTVNEDQNAIILKIGYFLRRGSVHPLPPHEGYKLLKHYVEAETIGSKRWFFLQSVRGFAGLHLARDTHSDGMQAYEALFATASKSIPPGAESIVDRSIFEFVFTYPSEFGSQGGDSRTYASKTLLSALAVHTARLNSAANHPGIRLGYWSQAISMTTAPDDFIKVVTKAIAETDNSPSYMILATAAEIYQLHNVERAIAMLRQAKPLLTKDNTAQISDYYQFLVDLLLKQNQLAEAIQEQKELNLRTNTGYGRLFLLYHLAKDEQKVSELLTFFSEMKLSGENVTSTAAMLMELPGEFSLKEKLWDNARDILTHYLSQESHDLEQGLKSRLLLNTIYMSRKQYAEAKNILEVALHIKEEPIEDSTAVMALRSVVVKRIEELRNMLQN